MGVASSTTYADPSPAPFLPWQRWVALGLALFAFGVRFMGIEFDPGGYNLHADEWIPVELGHRLALDSDTPVRMWNYPPALANLAAVLFRVFPALDASPPDRYLAVRLLVFAMGYLALLLAAFTAFRVRGPQAALFALAVGAVSPLWVEQNRYAATDLPTALGVVATALCVTYFGSRRRAAAYVSAGLCVGLAAAFKYVGAISGALVLAAHLSQSTTRKDLRAWVLLLVAAALAVATFVLFNYQVWVAFDTMVEWLNKEYAHYASVGHPGYSSDAVWKYALPYFATYGLGWGGTIAALGALAWSAFDRNARVRLLPIGVFALAWLLYVASRRTFFARNMMHASPLFVMLAGVGFDLLRERTVNIARGGLTAAVVLLALAMPAWQSVSFALLLRETDTRIVAAEWMKANLPKGTRVAQVPDGIRSYWPVPQIHQLPTKNPRGYPSPAALAHNFDVVVVSFGQVSRYLRTPEEEPNKVRAFQSWYEALTHDAQHLASFSRPVGPGGDSFGATVDCYHNPRVEIYRLHE